MNAKPYSDIKNMVNRLSLVDGVFLLYGCCDPFNEKALRASRGAFFQLPIVSGEWTHLKSLKEESEIRILAEHPANSAESKLVQSIMIGSYEFFAHEVENQPVWLVSADDLNHGKRYKL
ncbi:hypothetical protein M9H77_19089 [Catharanthus roseus]|uniref:Uncharacterized protein n=1 Tax=Catharanthus roseus TaxID=4058 RepID=A0ACC0B9B6_CATRO|nr:hypothetical protein M9H77_19089 [Catharanthus roseus]